jgi:hypothetical protein
MENNTDIIVLTSVVIVLFIVFIIATLREFNTMSTTKFVEKEEGGPRAEMMRFIGKLFTDDRIDAGKKMTFMNAVKPILEDLLPEEELKKE